MESKHTPGPWVVGSRYTQSGVYTEGGYLVANTHGSQRTFNREAQIAEQDANARLIAAAPELLDALEWVWHNAMSAERGEIQASVEAAIAKARGQA